MNTRHFLSIGFGLAITAFALAASAQQSSSGTTHASATFQNLDKNQDGHLSRSEIPADMPLLRTRLTTYDSNKDGQLDAREFAAAEAALHGGGHAGGGDSTPPQRH